MSATACAVIPNFSYSVPAGAEAPKLSMPTKPELASRAALAAAASDPSPAARRPRRRRARGAAGQDALAVGFVLLLEQLPAGHRHDTGADAFGLQDVAGLHGDGDFGAGGHQDRLTFAFGIGQNIGALGGQVLVLVLGPHGRQALTGQRQHRRRFFGAQRHFPRFGGFHRVGGAEHIGVGCGAADRQMLDRLVGRAVFAQTDAVMGHHEHRGHLHQRGQPHRGAGIVGEAHEGAAVGAYAAMQRHAVHRRGHAVFADAPIDVAALAVVDVKDAQIAGLGVVGPGQIGRAADGFGHDRVDDFQHHFR